MSQISAQISVYPLRRESIREPLESVIEAFRGFGVDVEPGPMSTMIAGRESSVFSALHAGFRAACADGDAVMVVSVSNACPVDVEPDESDSSDPVDRSDAMEDVDV